MLEVGKICAVDHTILINFLEHYRVCGIAKNWFISYLHDRRQLKSIGNTTSDLQLPTYLPGVHQGYSPWVLIVCTVIIHM